MKLSRLGEPHTFSPTTSWQAPSQDYGKGPRYLPSYSQQTLSTESEKSSVGEQGVTSYPKQGPSPLQTWKVGKRF